VGFRILLIDRDDERAASLEAALHASGYRVVGRVVSGDDALRRVRELAPDLIIVDVESPDRDTIESMRAVLQDRPRPVVMFVDRDEGTLAEEAIRAGVSSYIVDGLKTLQVKPIIQVAVAQFRHYQALREELDQARTDLKNRKLIERAKGILMEQRGLGEAEAYRALRRLAMEQNKRLAEIAESLVSVADLLKAPR
jgi:response regulator NasT